MRIDFTPIKQAIPQVVELPSAADNSNRIYQYIGATGTYTNGYFYKSDGSAWSQISVQPAGDSPITVIDLSEYSSANKFDFDSLTTAGLYFIKNTGVQETNAVNYPSVSGVQNVVMDYILSVTDISGAIAQNDGWFYRVKESGSTEWQGWYTYQDYSKIRYTPTSLPATGAKVAGSIAVAEWETAPILANETLNNIMGVNKNTALGIVEGETYTMTYRTNGTTYTATATAIVNSGKTILEYPSVYFKYNDSSYIYGTFRIYDNCEWTGGSVAGSSTIISQGKSCFGGGTSKVGNTTVTGITIEIISIQSNNASLYQATISNAAIKTNSLVQLFVNTSESIEADSKADGSIILKTNTLPSGAISYTLQIVETSAEGVFEIINAYIPSVPEVHGIPSGGTAGQVLKKTSETDYATEWGDTSGGGDTLIITKPYNDIDALTSDEVYQIRDAMAAGKTVEIIGTETDGDTVYNINVSKVLSVVDLSALNNTIVVYTLVTPLMGTTSIWAYKLTIPNATTTLIETNIPSVKKYTDTSVATTAFVSDATYTGYGYRAAIVLSGVTADMVAEVVFGLNEAVSGNYAPVAETYAGGVYIYAKAVPNSAITIPTITVTEVA